MESGTRDNYVEARDAYYYFSNNATVISITEVKDSEKVQSGYEVKKDMKNRGFLESDLFSEYTIDGEFVAEGIEIKPFTKSPMYQLLYVSDEGNYWTVYFIDGNVMANPVIYNLQHEVKIIISESNTLISYDGATNSFYETIPDQDVIMVMTVDRIDADTLDKLSIGE